MRSKRDGGRGGGGRIGQGGQENNQVCIEPRWEEGQRRPLMLIRVNLRLMKGRRQGGIGGSIHGTDYYLV